MSKAKKPPRRLYPTNDLQIPNNKYYLSRQTTKYFPAPNLQKPTAHIKTNLVSKNIHKK